MQLNSVNRIAVFGGTFDPPHNSHLTIAENVLCSNCADLVFFAPAWLPPHKLDREVSAFYHRLAMLEIALADKSGMQLSKVEAEGADGPSYTFDMMSRLEKEYSRDQLVLLLGSDSLCQLHSWYRAAELIERWPIISYPRLGEMPDCEILRRHWPEALVEKLMASLLPLPPLPIAATEIRTMVENGDDINAMVPQGVADYIYEHKLYRT